MMRKKLKRERRLFRILIKIFEKVAAMEQREEREEGEGEGSRAMEPPGSRGRIQVEKKK